MYYSFHDVKIKKKKCHLTGGKLKKKKNIPECSMDNKATYFGSGFSQKLHKI